MAGNLRNNAKSSLAKGSASAIEDAPAPRLRAAIKYTNKHSGSSFLPLSPASEHHALNSDNDDNNNTKTKTKMGSTDIYYKASAYPVVIGQEHFDYTGPLVDSPGETAHVLWPLIAAVMFAVLGFIYMVFSSMIGIAYVQFVKLFLTRRALEMKILKPALETFLGNFSKVLYRVQASLTFLLLPVLMALHFFDIPLLWVTLLFAAVIILMQGIHCALHGYLLHKHVTLYRSNNRRLMIESIDGAWRENFPYSSRFLLLFAGSGGHTTELLSLMRLYDPFNKSNLRRWVVTKGDQRSYDEILKFEQDRAKHLKAGVSGMFEIVWVSRARYVGQSWFTTPFTALNCVYDCYKILTMGRPFTEPGQPREFPQTIICNGPGSSVVFVWVSHMMRMYGMIPINRCTTLFVESIARVSTLSLTGKIFYWLDLADTFVVQHNKVAESYPDLVAEPMLVKRKFTSWEHEENVFGEDVANDITDF